MQASKLFGVTEARLQKLTPRAMENSTLQRVDVAVIGAGPAGLAAAKGLLAVEPGLNLKVYDKASSLRPVGAAVTLSNNGLSALEAVSPAAYDDLMTMATTGLGLQSWDMQDNLLSAKEMAQWSNGNADSTRTRPPVYISWYDLQQVLLRALPSGTLELKHGLKSVSQDSNGAVLQFEDGSQVAAQYVVGADGNMSTVRAALFDGETPDYIGTAFWRTIVPKPADWHIPTGWISSWASDCRLMALRTFDKTLSVSAASAWPKERLQELWRKAYIGEEGRQSAEQRQSQKLERFMSLFSDFPATVTGLFKLVDPSLILEHGVYSRNPEAEWGKGMVTLVGDAAHVMPPNYGQGTAMALEDAYQLAAAVAEHGLSQAAFRAYESKQRQRVRPIALASLAGAHDFYQDKKKDSNPVGGKTNPELMQYIVDVHFYKLSELSKAKANAVALA